MSNLIIAKTVVKLDMSIPAPTGSIHASILRVKSAGIVRDKTNEPWEGEWLLLASRYGCQCGLDLTSLQTTTMRMELDECRKMEPGTIKYYLVRLHTNLNPRKLGSTPIACEHLAKGKSFDLLDQALEAFRNA